ncbi:MAG: hypothetical protein K0U74_05315 [Alphaproteobacteria bacterium]|nr:hypothetical protein [Alphaproteobacteria bacterium]
MSSFEQQKGIVPTRRQVTHRRFAHGPATALSACLAILLIAPILTACGNGFRPVHADFAGMTPASEKLKKIKISPIPGRVGQQIRNELIFKANGGAQPLPPEYKLEIAIREKVTSTLVARTGDARSQVYSLDAKFKLTRVSDKSVILSGTSYARAGFERFDSIYSNVRARHDAENRAAKTIATDLKARLAAIAALPS